MSDEKKHLVANAGVNNYGLHHNEAEHGIKDTGRKPHADGVFNAQTGEYTIKKDDTLFSLAKRFNTSVDVIRRATPGGSGELKAGGVLRLGSPQHPEKKEKAMPAEIKSHPTPKPDAGTDHNKIFTDFLNQLLNPLKNITLPTAKQNSDKPLSGSIKAWYQRTVSANDTAEKNKQYAQLLIDAETSGLIGIDSVVRQTLVDITEGKEIGNGKKNKVEAGNTFDPTDKEIPILPLLVSMIRGFIKTYGNQATEHKFEMGTLMIWNHDYPAKNGYAGELRGSYHGPGKAIDTHAMEGSKTYKFDQPKAVTFVMEMLKQLPTGSYGIGLPIEGDFFPIKKGLVLGTGDANTYKLLISKELTNLIESLNKKGVKLIVFPDAPDHLHIQKYDK